MAIPTILQGDTASRIELTIANGWDFDGVALDVNICNFTATIVSPVAGVTIDLFLSAEDTALFPLGTHKVTMTLRNDKGDKATLPWAKIKVTDSPAEVLAAAIAVNPSTLKVTDATAADSLGDVKYKLNEVLAFLRKGAVACLALLPILSLGAGVASAPLNDIAGNAMVVTNVDLNGLATPADIEAKRDKADMAVYETIPKTTDWKYEVVNPVEGNIAVRHFIVEWFESSGGVGWHMQPESRFLDNDPNATNPNATRLEIPYVHYELDDGSLHVADWGIATRKIAGTYPTTDTIATMSAVTNAARSVVNTVWDAALGVAWEARMHNGALYYIAVTNRPPEVAQ